MKKILPIFLFINCITLYSQSEILDGYYSAADSLKIKRNFIKHFFIKKSVTFIKHESFYEEIENKTNILLSLKSPYKHFFVKQDSLEPVFIEIYWYNSIRKLRSDASIISYLTHSRKTGINFSHNKHLLKNRIIFRYYNTIWTISISSLNDNDDILKKSMISIFSTMNLEGIEIIFDGGRDWLKE